MPRVRKCAPDCTCHRHRKCPEGCTCDRHRGVFCAPGCTCDRHSMRKCEDGCTCGKHSGELTYFALHLRVHRRRGKARDQVCVTCGKAAQHWSQVHETDGTDTMNHYRPMCVSCHFAYDGNQAKAAAASRGREVTAEQRAQRSEAMRRYNAALTPEQRSENARKAWKTRRAQEVGD